MSLARNVQIMAEGFMNRMRYAQSCSCDNALITTLETTHAVTSGRVYRTFYVVPKGSTLAADGEINIVIEVGLYDVRVAGIVSLGDEADVETFIAPTYDPDGAALPVINLNGRAGFQTSSTGAVLNPTINTTGTKIRHQYYPSGKKEGATQLFEGAATIAVAGTKILARLTNSSSNAVRFGVEIWWTEFR